MRAEPDNERFELQRVSDMINTCLLGTQIVNERSGKEIYVPSSITSYSNAGNILRFKYDGKDMEITFSNDTGPKAVVEHIKERKKNEYR